MDSATYLHHRSGSRHCRSLDKLPIAFWKQIEDRPLKKYFAPLLIAAIFATAPAFAQSSDGYDMSNFKAGAETFGLSEFRITPDMYPEHSYHRKALMKDYGPRGKAVGFSTVSGKAFDYLNAETLKTKRYQPKESDPYLDAAYSAPKVDGNYDPAYHSSKSFSASGASELKPLGPKHSATSNPFNSLGNAGRLFSTEAPASDGGRSFSGGLNSNFSQKFNSGNNDLVNPSADQKVFDGESMF